MEGLMVTGKTSSKVGCLQFKARGFRAIVGLIFFGVAADTVVLLE